MEQFRFTFQQNQFWGKCEPCTPAVFNTTIDSAVVARTIGMRQEIEAAIAQGQPLDKWLGDAEFRKFCAMNEQKPRAGANFHLLTPQQKLIQWANALKMGLPCFIYGVRRFDGVRRRQAEIKELSALFMFDGDKLPMHPRELFERTQVPGFNWTVRLAHATSSGHGLRLVCEARPELGNIADNQICLARDLGLMGVIGTTGKPVVDDSCIDACRISYAPRRQDIYYMDENGLFNYQNNE